MTSIILDNCSLRLPIYGTINRSLKGTVMATATGGRIAAASKHVTVVEALRGISLDIRAGDRIGIRGHNGAGKTSLLRMIAGIYEPTSGRIMVQGKVSSFINLGMGMDLEATGRENILLCGLMRCLECGAAVWASGCLQCAVFGAPLSGVNAAFVPAGPAQHLQRFARVGKAARLLA